MKQIEQKKMNLEVILRKGKFKIQINIFYFHICVVVRENI